MPVGYFTPFDEREMTPRIFARPITFDCECPFCGRLFLVGPQRRDNHRFNRVTSMLRCTMHRGGGETLGCGRVFLVGMVFYPMQASTKRGRPYDQRPTDLQLAELRAAGAGIYARNTKRKRTERVNQIQPEVALEDPKEP